MEKHSETFLFNPGLHPPMNNNGRNPPVAPQPSSSAIQEDERSNCFCFESDDDSTEKIRLKYTKRKLARGCLSNMTICIILVGYTFLGAIIFLAIEGGSILYGLGQQKNVGPTFASVSPRFTNNSTSVWIERLSEEARVKTVENIWEITVSLNILYKDNWTRLAAQEITRFQENLVKHLTEEMSYQAAASNELRSQETQVEWTLGRAFLYSLTVLTTVAACRSNDGGGYRGPCDYNLHCGGTHCTQRNRDSPALREEYVYLQPYQSKEVSHTEES